MNKCNPSAASSPRAGQALALLAIIATERRGQKYQQEHGDTCGEIVLKSSHWRIRRSRVRRGRRDIAEQVQSVVARDALPVAMAASARSLWSAGLEPPH
jgi:hypothetical protein